MKNSIIFSIIAFIFIAFIVFTVYKNAKYNDIWKNRITFEGKIQSVVHIRNTKGSFFKVNDNWYELSYNRAFESQNYVGLKIYKLVNEEGVWIEKDKGSDSLIFYWGRGNIVKDSLKLKLLINN